MSQSNSNNKEDEVTIALIHLGYVPTSIQPSAFTEVAVEKGFTATFSSSFMQIVIELGTLIRPYGL